MNPHGNPQRLFDKKAKLEAQLESARQKELATVTEQVQQVVQEYGLTADDIGLLPKRSKRAGAKTPVAPKYLDPKTGATWPGRGRAPACDKFLIA
ncbi:H-NS histone family protein [Ralstonia solanacearum]|nr:H-NS histone family protein [Ralstonia solanacearum]MDB0569104.1 H-NS histone family protein [Ralstonia solanacearum]